MSCCDGMEGDEKPNGRCIDCGELTIDGEAYESCGYSPVVCKTCGDAPCDGSC